MKNTAKKRAIPSVTTEVEFYDPEEWQRQGFCFYCLMPLEIRFAGKDVRHAHNFTPYSRCAQARTKRDEQH